MPYHFQKIPLFQLTPPGVRRPFLTPGSWNAIRAALERPFAPIPPFGFRAVWREPSPGSAAEFGKRIAREVRSLRPQPV